MFITEKAALASALATVKGAIEARNTIPILSNVLLERDGDSLVARSTNLDMEIATRLNANIDPEFEPFTCSASMLTDIVRNTPDGFEVAVKPIHTAGKLSSIIVAAGKSRLKLPTLPATDFPKLDAGKMDHRFSFNAELMVKGLNSVSFAAGTEEQRFFLCGVYLHAHEDGLTFVATDGHRLSKRVIPAIQFDDDLQGLPSVIVPNAAIAPIMRILDKQTDVTVDVSDVKIRVSAGDTVITSKLVDGTYPDYNRIVRIQEDTTATFSGKALSSAIARVMSVSPNGSKGIRFEFRKDSIALLARDVAHGEGEDEIAATVTGDLPLTVGFNGKYVREALSFLDTDDAVLVAGAGNSPARLTSANSEHHSIIIMPTRLLWAN